MKGESGRLTAFAAEEAMKRGRVLIMLALVIALVSFIMGCIHYGVLCAGDGGSLPSVPAAAMVIAASLHNAVSGFFFSPSLGIGDAIKTANREAFSGIWLIQLIAMLYAIAIFLAPLFTISAIGLFAKKEFYRLRMFFYRYQRKSVLIFGEQKDVLRFLGSSRVEANERLHIITDGMEEAEEIALLKKGVLLHRCDVTELTDKEFTDLMKAADLERCSEIYLMHTSAAANFSIYMKLCKLCQPGLETGIYCRSEQEEFKKVFHNYYDVHKETFPAPKIYNHADIKASAILNIRDLKLSDLEENSRLLLIGLGAVGKQVLLRLINQAVFSGDNVIHVDIIDFNIEAKMDSFLRDCDPSCVTIDGSKVTINSAYADGELILEFHGMYAGGKRFSDYLAENAFGYHYTVICFEDVAECLNCVEQLTDYILRNGIRCFPVVVGVDSQPEVLISIRQEGDKYRQVYFTGRTDLYNRRAIIDAALEEKAKAFHLQYQVLSPHRSGDENRVKDWYAIALYKQENSRQIARHQSIMHDLTEAELKDRKAACLQEWFGEEGTIMQWRNGTFVYDISEQELTDRINAVPFLKMIGRTEHRRWCYMAMFSGWRYGEKRSEEKRESPYLLPWEALCRSYPEVVAYDLMPILYEAKLVMEERCE